MQVFYCEKRLPLNSPFIDVVSSAARYAFLFLAVFIFCACDQCEDVNCSEHGSCLDGECNCSRPYYGNDCSLQRTPNAIVIEKVTFKYVPRDVLDYPWDPETPEEVRPDVFLILRKGTNPDIWFKSEECYWNTEGEDFIFTGGFPLEYTNFLEPVRFSLNEQDENYYYELYWANGLLYYDKNGFPDELKLVYNDGTVIIVDVAYKFI